MNRYTVAALKLQYIPFLSGTLVTAEAAVEVGCVLRAVLRVVLWVGFRE